MIQDSTHPNATPRVNNSRFMIKTNDYKDDDGKGFVIIIKKHDKILC